MDKFLIGLTNDDPSTTVPIYRCMYTICAQYNGSLPAGKDVTVHCAPTNETFQFVILHGYSMRSKSLCLAEVAVFVGCK